ncbi:nuclear transport factor 2 family protein [Arthrobacter russicus]|uniref:Ketosteroid isomerase-like protein n=1 Tax=Arthrobacter russicus TaxID=172040 RepID=A0ABU1JCZ8_9MICC|nr:nuclear transport factor 2 family protein [Arthrobacter russicus]MDR6270307.1 ketosteroid isomerase-like protein [Arthrobacter russicus]
MSYSTQEQENLDAVRKALDGAATDFGKLSEVFAEDIEWTITGHGPVARTFHGIASLIDDAEQDLFDRISGTLRVAQKGTWADGNKVFVHMTSAGEAVDGEPYNNEYLYIFTMKDQKAVTCTAWLDRHAYYGIVERIRL